MDAFAKMLVADGMSEQLASMCAQTRLIIQSERLRRSVRDAACQHTPDSAEYRRIWDVVRKLDDRTSRREYRYECERDGRTPVTTAQIAAWVRANISRYERFGEADPAEIAGDVCSTFALWDEHDSIPAWVWGLCERVAPQAIAEMMRNRCFFVEKPVHYEPDGDVLWK